MSFAHFFFLLYPGVPISKECGYFTAPLLARSSTLLESGSLPEPIDTTFLAIFNFSQEHVFVSSIFQNAALPLLVFTVLKSQPLISFFHHYTVVLQLIGITAHFPCKIVCFFGKNDVVW